MGTIEIASDRLAVVRDEIEARYRERLSLTGLARKACLSPERFCRVFRQRYGIAPIAYQRHLRMNAAKTLLASTGLRVGEVAVQVGYRDVYLFSKMFKRAMGQPPRNCRARS
jgi:transcriptional regulator GlxA family with amidase domain